MNLRAAIAVVAAAAAVAFGLASCDEVESYIYSAQRVDTENACVEEYVPLETINGSGANSTCPRTCFMFRGSVYVSLMCPPLPPSAEPLEPSSAECVAALAAADTPCEESSDPGDEDGGADDDADSDDDAGEEPDTGTPVDSSDDG